MKKVLGLLVLLAFTLVLSGCGEEDHLSSIKDKLEDIGYVFEQRDDDAITYYNNKAVNEAFEVDVTLTDLYIGYVDSNQHWLELLVFDSEGDAQDYVDNCDAGYIIYREGNVLFITFWDGAMAPFVEDSVKDS